MITAARVSGDNHICYRSRFRHDDEPAQPGPRNDNSGPRFVPGIRGLATDKTLLAPDWPASTGGNAPRCRKYLSCQKPEVGLSRPPKCPVPSSYNKPALYSFHLSKHRSNEGRCLFSTTFGRVEFDSRRLVALASIPHRR